MFCASFCSSSDSRSKKDQGYKKADILAALKGENYDHNLPVSAQQALAAASSNMRFTELDAIQEISLEDEAERERIKEEKLSASMPYAMPPLAEHDDRALEWNKDVVMYEPRSASKWYKKVSLP